MTLRWLTADGAVVAALVGALVFWGAGVEGFALLAVFFISGSLLTAWNQRQPQGPDGAQGPQFPDTALRPLRPLPPLRNARQVIANGGCAALGAALARWDSNIGWAVLLGSLATAQADTWATEIGAHASHPPRLITNGQPVAVGTSGGVSPLGTSAGLLGAMVLSGAGVLLGIPLQMAVIGTGVGVFGMLVDSLLGATLEAATFLDNDGVNLVATSVGAVAAVALSQAATL